MSFLQAALIALICYLGALSTPWILGTTGGWYTLTRPLVAGFLVGLILGDVTTGVLIGVAVQAVFIGLITPGGTVPADLSFVCYLGIPLAMISGAAPEVAVSISVGFGVIGVAVWQIFSVGNAAWAHLGDRYAEEGNLEGIIRINYLAQIPWFFLRGVLPFAILFFGGELAPNLITFLETQAPWFLEFLGLLGGAFPAVGIAILLLQITPNVRMLMWFILGWAAVSYLGLSIVAIAVFGVIIALVYYMYFSRMEETTVEA